MAEQYQVIRDILFLYWELATNWGYINGDAEFGGFELWKSLAIDGAAYDDGDAEFGGFDRWKWLQCEPDDDVGRSVEDTLLLRQGSAVALLCEMNYEWDHYDEVREQVWRVALEAGRFDLLPEARDAVEAGLQGQEEMRKQLDVVYDEYVVACFEYQARSAQGGAPPWSFRDPPQEAT